MNGEEISQNAIQNKPKSGVASLIEKVKSIASKIKDFIPAPFKKIAIKFYSNKKIFIPVTVAFGLVFLILILGLIFGSKNAPVVISPKATPTQLNTPTPTASESGDILTVTEKNLRYLNGQINGLDVRQRKLSPPAINFDVSF